MIIYWTASENYPKAKNNNIIIKYCQMHNNLYVNSYNN